MSDLKCPKCNTPMECMGGRSAHHSNWYCPTCSNKSDTSRTDAFCTTPTEYYVGQESRLIPGWIDFARQLERELAAVTEERDALAAAIKLKEEQFDALLESRRNVAQDRQDAVGRAEKAEAECERLREDAERYRWLITEGGIEWNPAHDAAIDAARGK